jgi:hypothetical protein
VKTSHHSSFPHKNSFNLPLSYIQKCLLKPFLSRKRMMAAEDEFRPLSKPGFVTFRSIQKKTAGEASLSGG